MIVTNMVSIRHPLAQPFCLSTQSMEASCGKFHVQCARVRVACGKVRVACNISRGKTPSVAGFLVALRGVGGRLSQFCGSSFNDDPQSGAARDEVVELQPSFERLPPFAQAVLSSGTAPDGTLLVCVRSPNSEVKKPCPRELGSLGACPLGQVRVEVLEPATRR